VGRHALREAIAGGASVAEIAEKLPTGYDLLCVGKTAEERQALGGKVFDVLGHPIDNKGPVKAEVSLPIHREPPPFDQQTTQVFHIGAAPRAGPRGGAPGRRPLPHEADRPGDDRHGAQARAGGDAR